MHVIEVFAGAAGLAQGFERAGHYTTAALYDTFRPAQQSYQAYRPDAAYVLQDVRALTAAQVLETLDGRTLHGILGGPPCQGFSLAGKRDKQSDTNQLVLAYARIVKDLAPHFLVMENVPQLLFHPFFAPLRQELEQHYHVTHKILNAAQYGAPQTRHRLILIAYRKTHGVRPSLPAPSHGQLGQSLYAYHLADSDARVTLDETTAEVIFGADPVIRQELRGAGLQAAQERITISAYMQPLITVGAAISDLSSTSEPTANTIPYRSVPAGDYQHRLRGGGTQVANCLARQHVGEPLHIVKALREGGTPQADASGARNKRYYSQAYGRLHRAALARTLTTFFQNAGSGRFFHYEQPRTLTVREAARLQGFSDDFVFRGTLTAQMQLVGNAVPLPLAEALGRHIAVELGPHLPT